MRSAKKHSDYGRTFWDLSSTRSLEVVCINAIKGQGFGLSPFLYRRSALIFDHKTGKQQVSRFIRHRRLQSTGRFRIIAFKLRDG